MMSERPASIVESDYFTAHVPEHKLERILAAVQTPRHAALLAEAHGHARFAAWLLLADIWLRRRIGVVHSDLADYSWFDDYAAGVHPTSAGADALSRDDIAVLLGDPASE